MAAFSNRLISDNFILIDRGPGPTTVVVMRALRRSSFKLAIKPSAPRSVISQINCQWPGGASLSSHNRR
jgi:hypothetical protein